MGELARNPPPVFRTLMAILDPADGGAAIVIPADLLAQHPEIGRDQLVECRNFLDRLLGGDATPNADLKGMLNRLAGHRAWGVSFDFGGDAMGARRFPKARRVALTRTLA